MAGARAKPKCDVVGGKRLPDLKSLQAGKSKRRKLQEGKEKKKIPQTTSTRNQKMLHLDPALSKAAVGLDTGGLGKKPRLQEPVASILRNECFTPKWSPVPQISSSLLACAGSKAGCRCLLLYSKSRAVLVSPSPPPSFPEPGDQYSTGVQTKKVKVKC